MARDMNSSPKENPKKKDPLVYELVKINYFNLQESISILCRKRTHQQSSQPALNASQSKNDACTPYNMMNTDPLDILTWSDSKKVPRLFQELQQQTDTGVETHEQVDILGMDLKKLKKKYAKEHQLRRDAEATTKTQQYEIDGLQIQVHDLQQKTLLPSALLLSGRQSLKLPDPEKLDGETNST